MESKIDRAAAFDSHHAMRWVVTVGAPGGCQACRRAPTSTTCNTNTDLALPSWQTLGNPEQSRTTLEAPPVLATRHCTVDTHVPLQANERQQREQHVLSRVDAYFVYPPRNTSVCVCVGACLGIYADVNAQADSSPSPQHHQSISHSDLLRTHTRSYKENNTGRRHLVL